MKHREFPVRAAWAQRKERSNLALLRAMTWISLRFGRPFGRVVLRPIAAYFMLTSPSSRQASRAYLRRALGRPARWRDVYRHMFDFAATIHDRLYLLNERFDLFDIRVHGGELIEAALAQGQGGFLIGAHLGSFEVVRAIGRTRPDLRVAIMMYEQNARNINAILAMVNSAVKHDVIGLGQPDSMLKAREYLDQGCMIGMLADRTLSGENGESLERFDFLGASAGFPLGPLRMAAMLRRPAIFMTGLYRGNNRYDVHFEALADFSAVSSGDRTVRVRSALERYVALVEKYCRAAPYNWFNYFDFWHEDSPGAAHDEGGCDKARSASCAPIVRSTDV